ncbi:MAG: DUF3365 domain-containing protein [bacterium]
MKKFINWLLYPESLLRLALSLSFPLLIVLVILVFTMIRWEKKSLEDIQTGNLKEISQAFYNHILATDIWRQSHGGVFIEAVQHSGQQMSQKPLSIMGREFVKIDPALVTNQILELLDKRGAYRFHITSLQPVTQASIPDPWEFNALREFNSGKTEVTTVLEVNTARYFRHIVPLRLDDRCVQCHKPAGLYSPDMIIGGLSIIIPMETTDRLFAAQTKRSALSFAGFGIVLIVFILPLTLYFSHRITSLFKEKTAQQEMLKKLYAQLSQLSARDQAILASIVDGIAIINEAGVIESVNAAFAAMTGVQQEALKGVQVAALKEPLVLGEIFTCNSHCEIQFKNRIYIVTEVPIPDKTDQGLICTLRIVHDATDEKLSAAMELAGTAAHEVRQPLAILVSMMDMIREDIKTGQDFSKKIPIFEQQLTRINDIIAKMLNITRYQTKPYTDETKIFDLG